MKVNGKETKRTVKVHTTIQMVSITLVNGRTIPPMGREQRFIRMATHIRGNFVKVCFTVLESSNMLMGEFMKVVGNEVNDTERFNGRHRVVR